MTLIAFITLAAIGLYLALFYLAGLALFRALRYRLSRTYWHGIRGGSDDGGWSYAGSAMLKYIIGFVTLGFLVPWAMVKLWRERWGKMSFGPYAFEPGDGPAVQGLIGRYLLINATPVLWAILVFALGMGTIFTFRPGAQAWETPVSISETGLTTRWVSDSDWASLVGSADGNRPTGWRTEQVLSGVARGCSTPDFQEGDELLVGVCMSMRPARARWSCLQQNSTQRADAGASTKASSAPRVSQTAARLALGI